MLAQSSQLLASFGVSPVLPPRSTLTRRAAQFIAGLSRSVENLFGLVWAFEFSFSHGNPIQPKRCLLKEGEAHSSRLGVSAKDVAQLGHQTRPLSALEQMSHVLKTRGLMKVRGSRQK